VSVWSRGTLEKFIMHVQQAITAIKGKKGKYAYLRLPIGIAGSPDIFQAKMSALIVALKFVKTYLDDLLYITWSSLEDHLEKLREVLPDCKKWA